MRRSSTCLFGAAIVLAMGQAAFGQTEKQWDLLAKQVLAGEKLSPETIARCDKEFVDYSDRLLLKNKTKDLAGLSDEDNAAHYANAIKWAVIDPAKHGGWPVRHVGIGRAYGVLKARLETEDKADLMVAAIIPSLAKGDAPFALAVYRRLQVKDPAWARYVLGIVQKVSSNTPKGAALVAAFVAAPPEDSAWGDRFQWKQQNYITFIPTEMLRASPTLDLARPELPVPWEKIVAAALGEVEKITGSKAGWECTEMRLCRPPSSHPDTALRQKWYYQVFLSRDVLAVEDRGAIIIDVTIDGHPGVVQPRNAAEGPNGTRGTEVKVLR